MFEAPKAELIKMALAVSTSNDPTEEEEEEELTMGLGDCLE